jgi:hypothetical protein
MRLWTEMKKKKKKKRSEASGMFGRPAHPWNLAISYNFSSDRKMEGLGYRFLGAATDGYGRDVRIYRMYRVKEVKK